MPTPLRAFLMLRTSGGEWGVTVHRDLEGLLAAWKSRPNPDATTGVIHVGFDRPPSKEFDSLARGHPGRVLVTVAAAFALPADFHSSLSPVGYVGSLPVHLGTRGWGYLIDDFDVRISAQEKIVTEEAAEGWVREFADRLPAAAEQLRAARIRNDEEYLAGERHLPVQLRYEMGLHRFAYLIGDDREDPCAFARAAPPWLVDREFGTMDLTVRVANVFVSLGVTKVGDLSKYTLHQLLGWQNFGRKSVADLTASLEAALQEGPFSVAARLEDAANDALLASIRRSLLKYSDRERDIIKRRMGLDGVAQTLAEIASVYGITRERVRQIEAKVIKRLRREEYWDDLLTKKLTSLLQDREFPLPALGVEAADPWFVGIAQLPGALRYVLTNICGGRAGLVTIDHVDYFTFIEQERWEATLGEARRLLETGIGREWSASHCRTVVEGLLPDSAREFRSLLWDKASALCHFTDDGKGGRLLVSYGRGAEHVVEAVLEGSECPLHFSEIARLASARAGREIDPRRAHGAAAAVGLLMGRGIYGLEKHIPIDPKSLEALGDEAEEIVADGLPGRQWHSSEILAALVERGSGHASAADKYIVDIALEKSGGLRSFGRMIWASDEIESGHPSSRIDVRQAVIALLQQAGRPLRASEIRQRLIAIRGLSDHFQITAEDPLIRIGAGLWGLNDRDISLKRKHQPRLLDEFVEVLQRKGSGIHLSEVASGLDEAQGVSAEAIFSLCAADRRMRVNQAQYLYLEEWGDPRRESVSDAVEAVLASADNPLAFDDIVQAVERRTGRVCERAAISGCLTALEAVFDRETGRWSVGSPMDWESPSELRLPSNREPIGADLRPPTGQLPEIT